MGRIIKIKVLFFMLFASNLLPGFSQVQPHHIFDNNMVLQREKPVKIWGLASPGTVVHIEFNKQLKTTVTSEDGEWAVYLDAMAANAEPQDMKVSDRRSVVEFSNVVVGDVWILGGQSNMEFDLERIFQGDVEILSANFPNIRLMTIPRASGIEPVKDFERINEYDSWYQRHKEKGYWVQCSPETVRIFAGLGYIFGRRLHMASQVPIGLIDVSRGGTTLEAWLSPEMLENIPENGPLLAVWKNRAESYDPEENLKEKIRNWEIRSELRKQQGLEPNPKPQEPDPSPVYDYNYPGSSYNGMVAVIAGFTARGIVFHHGYNNALGDSRPKLYAKNFKGLILDWRKTFDDENLPFGIIELSAGGAPQTHENFELRMVDAAPYIREAQFAAFSELSNTGFACAYDQQVNWYHPQKKVELGERMARWALSTQHGFEIKADHALFESAVQHEGGMIVSFTEEVKSSDDRPFEGFAVAGHDKRFYPAQAEYDVMGNNERGQAIYDKKRIVVRSDLVPEPVAIRYAWARNPLGNLIHNQTRILPVPPFRSDTWGYPEAPFIESEQTAHRERLRSLQKQAEEWALDRMIREAGHYIKTHSEPE